MSVCCLFIKDLTAVEVMTVMTTMTMLTKTIMTLTADCVSVVCLCAGPDGDGEGVAQHAAHLLNRVVWHQNRPLVSTDPLTNGPTH